MTEAPDAPPLGAADLRLRGDPPRVMRLSRKALATAGLVVTAGVGGALIYALQPSAPKPPNELYETENRATSDSLAGAPKDYSQIPRLGPPLPGDLGRPILSARERGVDASTPPMGVPAPPNAAPDAAQAARDRARQERGAARTSKMFVSDGVMASTDGGTSPRTAPAPVSAGPAGPTAAAAGEPSATRSFLTPGENWPGESSHRLSALTSPYVVQAGSVIPAALITGIRSDLPGTITAQVTQNVYDSVSGPLSSDPPGKQADRRI
jgi:type IV secretory pathway VirB10-like protein